jgi:hypothetical protein
MIVDRYTATLTLAMDKNTTRGPSRASQSLATQVQIHTMADLSDATVTMSSIDSSLWQSRA